MSKSTSEQWVQKVTTLLLYTLLYTEHYAFNP
jgi:hypothetical protein